MTDSTEVINKIDWEYSRTQLKHTGWCGKLQKCFYIKDIRKSIGMIKERDDGYDLSIDGENYTTVFIAHGKTVKELKLLAEQYQAKDGEK